MTERGRRWRGGTIRLAAIGMIAMAQMGLVMTTGANAQTPAMAPQGPRSVTVTAVGSVAAEPDSARVSAGVTSEGATAREALAANSADMKRVIEALKGAGIEARDIQTQRFHIEPRTQHFNDGRPPIVTGYRVSNQVTVTMRKLDGLGSVLDALVKAGANQISGPSFEVSTAETLKDEARRQAVANALRRANLFAAATGAQVGAVLAISEDTAHVAPRGAPMLRQAMAADAVPIEAGETMLEARVTITWELK